MSIHKDNIHKNFIKNYTAEVAKTSGADNLVPIFNRNSELFDKLYDYSYNRTGPKMRPMFDYIENLIKDFDNKNTLGDRIYQIWLRSIDISLPKSIFKVNTVITGKRS